MRRLPSWQDINPSSSWLWHLGYAMCQQRIATLMNNVLRSLLDQCVVVYSNDILIYRWTLEEHKAHLAEVFQLLRENQLFVKKKVFLCPRRDPILESHRQEWIVEAKSWEVKGNPWLGALLCCKQCSMTVGDGETRGRRNGLWGRGDKGKKFRGRLSGMGGLGPGRGKHVSWNTGCKHTHPIANGDPRFFF